MNSLSIKVRNFLRNHVRSDFVYRYSRRILMLSQYVLKEPEEPEIKAFRILAEDYETGILIDVGANAGQTAVSLGFLCKKCEILSFEPNPALWPELDFVGRILGKRFSYERLGLGNAQAILDLEIPYLRNLPLTTRGSLVSDRSEKVANSLAREHHHAVEIRSVKVQVTCLDNLDLAPIGVKIDVEGHELAVLQGMIETIKKHRPLMMLESNPNNNECCALFEEQGYCFYSYNRHKRTYSKTGIPIGQNWFAVPPHLQKRFVNMLPVR